MPQVTNEELVLLKEFLASRRPTIRREGPDPAHRGVIDPNYVRGSDVREFPKMIYRKSARDPKGYLTRVVESAEEQAAAARQGWVVTTREIHALLDEVTRPKVVEEAIALQEK